jgi:hypothetical protein
MIIRVGGFLEEYEMDQREAYKKFKLIAKGPVDEEQFGKMLGEEATTILESRISHGLSKYSECVQQAYKNIIAWYEQAYEEKINNLPKFIADHRRTYVWTIFLRYSHEPEFKTVVWLAGKLIS